MTTTITCDTTATDDDGNIHAVIFETGVTRNPDVWAGLDVGSEFTITDETTGVVSTGTLVSWDVSRDVVHPTATRIELVIAPG